MASSACLSSKFICHLLCLPQQVCLDLPDNALPLEIPEHPEQQLESENDKLDSH